jgi:hypothetical protein
MSTFLIDDIYQESRLKDALENLKRVEKHLDTIEEKEILISGVEQSSLAVKWLENKFAYQNTFENARNLASYKYIQHFDESKVIDLPIAHIDINEFPDLQLKPNPDVKHEKLSYLAWILSVMETQVPIGGNLVTAREQIGDYVVLPLKISQTHRTMIRNYEILANTFGFSVDNEHVSYTGKFDYKMVYKSEHFMLCRVEPEPKQFFTTTVKQLFKHALNKLSFGMYELDPEYVQLASGYKVRYRTTADLLWQIVFIPFMEVNIYFNMVRPALNSNGVDGRIRNAIGDFGAKNKTNPDLLTFQATLAVGLAYNWENNTPKQKEEKIVTDFDTIYGTCSGDQSSDVKLKRGAKILNDIVNVIGKECVDSRQVAWAYERCLSSKKISERCNMLFPLGCAHDGTNACVCRQLKEVNEPLKEEMEKLNDFTHSILPQILPVLKTRCMSQEKWLQHLRHEQFIQYGEGRFDEYAYQYSFNQTDTRAKAFVKMEPHFKPVVKPRFITSRKSALNLRLGKWTYSASKIMGTILNYKDHSYSKFNQNCEEFEKNGLVYDSTKEKYYKRLVYAGGHNRDSLGDFIQEIMTAYTKPIFLSTDFSKFDSHISPTLKCILECSLMEHLFPGNKEVQELLKTQLRTKGCMQSRRYGYSIRYEVEGTRGSGDQNTSVGNSFIAMLLQLYVINKQYNVLNLLERDKLRIINLGDDCLLAFDGWCPNIKQYEEDMFNCGMEVKAELSDITNVKFLSGMFVPAQRNVKDKDGKKVITPTYLHTPLIGRMIQKAFVSIHKYECKKTQQAWVRSNALAYRRMYSHITPMYVWFHRIYEKYSKVMKQAPKERERFLQTKFDYDPLYAKALPKNRLAFGIGSNGDIYPQNEINPRSQNLTEKMLCERYDLNQDEFKEWSKLLSVDDIDWNHPIWSKFIEKDCPVEESINDENPFLEYQDIKNEIKDDPYFEKIEIELRDDGYITFNNHDIANINIPPQVDATEENEFDHHTKLKFDTKEVQTCLDFKSESSEEKHNDHVAVCTNLKNLKDKQNFYNGIPKSNSIKEVYDKQRYLTFIKQLHKSSSNMSEKGDKLDKKTKPLTWFEEKKELIKGALKVNEDYIGKKLYEDKNLNFKRGPYDVEGWRRHGHSILSKTRRFKPCATIFNKRMCNNDRCNYYHNEQEQNCSITKQQFKDLMLEHVITRRIINYLLEGEYVDYNEKQKEQLQNKNKNVTQTAIASLKQHVKNQPILITCAPNKENQLLFDMGIITGDLSEQHQVTPIPVNPTSPTENTVKDIHEIEEKLGDVNNIDSPIYRPISPQQSKREMIEKLEQNLEDIYNGIATPPVGQEEYLAQTLKIHQEISDELQRAPVAITENCEAFHECKYQYNNSTQSNDNARKNHTYKQQYQEFIDLYIIPNIPMEEYLYYENENLYHVDPTYQAVCEEYIMQNVDENNFADLFDYLKGRDNVNDTFNYINENMEFKQYEQPSPPHEQMDLNDTFVPNFSTTLQNPKDIYEEASPINHNTSNS